MHILLNNDHLNIFLEDDMKFLERKTNNKFVTGQADKTKEQKIGIIYTYLINFFLLKNTFKGTSKKVLMTCELWLF